MWWLFREPNIYKMKEKRNVKGLIKALRYKDDWVRRDAAEALGEIKDTRAVEPLINALKDEDSSVRELAAEALEKLGWEPANANEKAAYAVAKQQWNECVMIGKLAVEPLINALRGRTVYVRRDAAKTLIKMYYSGQLDDAHKAMILAQRSIIIKSHHDAVCFGQHQDHGIGIDFPL